MIHPLEFLTLSSLVRCPQSGTLSLRPITELFRTYKNGQNLASFQSLECFLTLKQYFCVMKLRIRKTSDEEFYAL